MWQTQAGINARILRPESLFNNQINNAPIVYHTDTQKSEDGSNQIEW